MAEQKYYTIVTDLGAELMAKAVQKGEKINVISIAAGDGDGVFYKPTSDMIALKREIWRGEIQNYEIDSASRNVIKISGVIPKDVGHFTLREMAVFDDDNNMIAVCNAPDLLKAVLEEGALTEAVVYMRIAVTNTDVVNIVVNNSAIYATVRELDGHKNDDNAHKKLFDEKVDKTDFIAELDKKVNETDFTTELNNKVDKTEFTTELNKKVDKTEFTTELNKKVDKTDFTGENIGELLEAAGWQSGTVINNIVDGEAEGSIKQVNATVSAKNAVAFGTSTASGELSHAEGEDTIASGYASHAEGCGYGKTNGEIFDTTASGRGAHAEGCGTIANGNYSHAEGYATQAKHACCHAEGDETIAEGNYGHAEGFMTKAYGGHAEGQCTEAKAYGGHAGGAYTIANAYQMAIGHFNIEKTGGRFETNTDNTSGTAFIIGNGKTAPSGSSPTRSNCFRVDYNGGTYASAAYNSSGADYAEYFEWLDNNENKEDRTGLFVTLEGKYIRIANKNDSYILGVVSACPSVVGNAQEDQWGDMYKKDIFGRIIKEQNIPIINTEYDNTKKYIPRSERTEWAAIGMLGKLVVIDDGSCKVNELCTIGENGVATKSNEKKGYYVMARLDENHIQIVFR